MAEKGKKVSTENYKGVRDFYPEDMFIENYIFRTMRTIAERFGYSEYGASILEPHELYLAKTGEEIVNEQTYTFEDRGGRLVTLRPEMTPTIARMIAARKRELSFPLRWYSIPNLFRYERPQRGRLREHWQLNIDIFGASGKKADMEIIQAAHALMRAFGAEDDQFVIRIGSRAFIEHLFTFYSLSDEEKHAVSKLLDKKSKMEDDAFKQELSAALKEKQDLPDILYRFFTTNDFSLLPEKLSDSPEKRELESVRAELATLDVENVVIDTTIMRGFDYYTGIVFEIFDTDPQNKRSLFGGGRYDDLLRIFGGDPLPAAGFGMGDVTIRDFLETHNLLPVYTSSTDLYLCVLDESAYLFAANLAETLRENGVNTAMDISGKKAGDQISTASKQFVPFVLCIGENEMQSGRFIVKNMKTGDEKECRDASEIISLITE